MPIYEFECQECLEISALKLKMSDPHPDACPRCSKGPVKKIISRSSFHLKGGGWYNDNYDTASNKPKESTTKKDSASSDAPATKTSEKTPETKSKGTSGTASEGA